MAGRVIDATLRLTDRFTGPLGNATRQLMQSSKMFEKAGQQIQKTGKDIQAAGADVAKAVTLPLAGLGATAVKTAGDFEKAMDSVASVMGNKLKPGQIDELTAKAQEMGRKMKYSSSESADSFKLLAQAGWDAGKMMENIEGIMYFAGATGMELAGSANYVVSAMSGLGEASGYTAEIITNILAVASNSAKTDANMMGEAFAGISTTVGQMGYSMEDACVILGTLANANYEGSVAAQAFNRIIQKMSTDDNAVKMLKKLGVAMYDESGMARKLSDVFNDLRSAYAGIATDEERMAVVKEIGGEYSVKLQAILGAEQTAWDDLTEAMSDTAGACKEMYDVANDNLAGRLTVLGSTAESIAITFGQRLMPYAEKGVELAQELADKFAALGDEQVDQIIKWAGIAAAVGPAILIFGKTVAGIGTLVRAMGMLRGGFAVAKTVTAGLTFTAPLKSLGLLGKGFAALLGPAGTVIAVLAGIVAVGILVYKNWDTVREKGEQFGKYVGSIFERVGFGAESVRGKIDSVKEKFTEFGDKVRELWIVAEPTVKKIGDVMGFVFGGNIGAAIGAAIGWCTSFAHTTQEVFFGLMTAAGGLIDFLTGVFSGDWEKAWTGVKNIFKGIFDSLAALLKAPMNAVIGIINGAIGGINGIGLKIPDWVPGIGGKDFRVNVPPIPFLYKGTDNWRGGPAMIHDRGAEIVDLPRGSRVYPHDRSLSMARAEGARKGGNTVHIEKLADSIIIREEADADRIIDRLVKRLEELERDTVFV